MEIVHKSETLVEIDGRVRVERGPMLVTAVATEELLADDVTADHYAVGRFDKFGKVIVLGQEFSYLDYKAPKAEWPWHVYELCVEEWAGPDPKWRRRGHHATKDEAMIAAGALANQLAAGAAF